MDDLRPYHILEWVPRINMKPPFVSVTTSKKDTFAFRSTEFHIMSPWLFHYFVERIRLPPEWVHFALCRSVPEHPPTGSDLRVRSSTNLIGGVTSGWGPRKNESRGHSAGEFNIETR